MIFAVTTTDGVLITRLLPVRLRRLIDGVLFDAGRITWLDTGYSIEYTDENGDNEMLIGVTDLGVAPGGWEFLYSDITVEIAKWPRDEQVKVVSYRQITEADIPADRTFREAWEDTGAAVTPHMGKARTAHMGRIRAARDAELEAKDKLWMKAMGQKDQAAVDVTEAERQALRDIPETFDLSGATTADELKALWPAQLPPN